MLKFKNASEFLVFLSSTNAFISNNQEAMLQIERDEVMKQHLPIN